MKLKMIASAVAMVGLAAVGLVLAGDTFETRDEWTATGKDTVNVTVTNAATIGLIAPKVVISTTSHSSGTNAISLKTPFPFKGVCILKANSTNDNHITIATGAVIRASDNISLVAGNAVATSDQVILYVTETNKAYVIGGLVY